MKNLLLLVIVVAITSCSCLKMRNSPALVDDGKVLYHSNYSFTDSSDVAHFACEDFVRNALNKYTIASISKEFPDLLKTSKTPVVNKYDASIIDTIYTFSNSNNNIQIYKAQHNDFLVIFEVTDPKFFLPGNIKPGMKKDLFCQKFEISEKINNVVQIVNSEGTMRFMFYFKNSKLKQINSYLYLD